ncbi:MAG: bifunctional (p)ppGpp synthetase/guanosine-3',5'-bis(diphosphate) 3'-pyrophosphohydrolase [Chitinophagales bacterium]|nr:bifunctional (p)ppGpp synthetase/guanosine-3',5'-bis(diphosphate) 3'-pyrophosphohydrolase [Chitinophagales bacterium]
MDHSLAQSMTQTIVIDREAENKEILKQYRHLLKVIDPMLQKGDKQQIRAAFEMSMEAHKDMRRKSGEPYILHPLAVAQIVAEEMGLGPTSVVCALLHDVVEDTEVTLEEIGKEFGAQVAKIVDGLTKISGVFDLSSSEQAENFRKLLLTLTDDVRVILIKIADRLHNMRTMDFMPRHKQLKIASETSYLYAPLAHRLGLYQIKSELEDLSMKYTETDAYRMIAQRLNETKRERTRYINEFIKPLKDRLDREMVGKFKIYGRPKSIHSIWNKMKTKGVTFEEVYDLFAIRVLVDVPPELEKSECWKVYSIVTDSYRPNPSRLRDWISTPKANGYEALHTTVMGPKGRWVEVQVRTERMNEIAEKGYAAHWKYKEGSADNALDEWLERIREMLNNPDSNALDFINDFKLNLFQDEIYVFTPKGDLRMLPNGATTLDFAFEIHSDIGSTCIGAKVNHKLVPLSHKLANGDQVEIITSKKQKPNEDWLTYVTTGKAKSKIKASLKEEKKLLAAQGKEMLNRKLRHLKLHTNTSLVQDLSVYFKMPSTLDFYYNIAVKKIALKDIEKLQFSGTKLILPKEQERKISIEETVKNTLQKNAELLIFGENADKIDYKFANCCNPIPGDDVFGFITVSEGIKIHKTNCPNAVQLMSNYGYRIVKTKWTKSHELSFLTEIKISGIDDLGVMNKITNIISGELKLNMRSISIESHDGIFEGVINIFVNDTEQLEDLMAQLQRMDGILSVSRV